MTLPEPLQRFAQWYEDAQQRIHTDPNAVILATVGPDGQPSARVVLLKGFDARGFVFYTNFQSRKGVELLAHPRAALCFYWPALERQVRVEGEVLPVTNAEADDYFATRARASQVGAWASQQSQPLPSRQLLEERVAEVEQRFAGREVPRPAHWSGFVLKPIRMEFWQAGTHRLHQREQYTRQADHWIRQLLFP